MVTLARRSSALVWAHTLLPTAASAAAEEAASLSVRMMAPFVLKTQVFIKVLDYAKSVLQGLTVMVCTQNMVYKGHREILHMPNGYVP